MLIGADRVVTVTNVSVAIYLQWLELQPTEGDRHEDIGRVTSAEKPVSKTVFCGVFSSQTLNPQCENTKDDDIRKVFDGKVWMKDWNDFREYNRVGYTKLRQEWSG